MSCQKTLTFIGNPTITRDNSSDVGVSPTWTRTSLKITLNRPFEQDGVVWKMGLIWEMRTKGRFIYQLILDSLISFGFSDLKIWNNNIFYRIVNSCMIKKVIRFGREKECPSTSRSVDFFVSLFESSNENLSNCAINLCLIRYAYYTTKMPY